MDKVVKDSANTIDDTLMPIIWPLLAAEVKTMIEENLDLEMLLGMKDEDVGEVEEAVTDSKDEASEA